MIGCNGPHLSPSCIIMIHRKGMIVPIPIQSAGNACSCSTSRPHHRRDRADATFDTLHSRNFSYTSTSEFFRRMLGIWKVYITTPARLITSYQDITFTAVFCGGGGYI